MPAVAPALVAARGECSRRVETGGRIPGRAEGQCDLGVHLFSIGTLKAVAQVLWPDYRCGCRSFLVCHPRREDALRSGERQQRLNVVLVGCSQRVDIPSANTPRSDDVGAAPGELRTALLFGKNVSHEARVPAEIGRAHV